MDEVIVVKAEYQKVSAKRKSDVLHIFLKWIVSEFEKLEELE